MSEKDYQKRMDNILSNLEEVYQYAPRYIIEKYNFLFYFMERIKPIMTPFFTYYPDMRMIENEHGMLDLTRIHHRIFYLLAKNMDTMKYVPREYIYSSIFRDKINPPPVTIIQMHFLNLNKQLVKIGLKASNVRKKGSFIEKIKDFQCEGNPLDWKPYVLRFGYDDPFGGRCG